MMARSSSHPLSRVSHDAPYAKTYIMTHLRRPAFYVGGQESGLVFLFLYFH